MRRCWPLLLSSLLHLLILILTLTASPVSEDIQTNDKTQHDDHKNIVPKQVEVSLVEQEPAPDAIPEPLKPKAIKADDDCKDWFGGIGIRESIVGIVYEVVNGYPAHKAGILVGDRITPVSDRDIRGEVGTLISISVYRSSTEETLHLTLIRDKICTTD